MIEYPLAEGATGSLFDLYYALANPTTTPAPVTITFNTPGAARVTARNYTLAPQSRRTIFVDEIAGLENVAVSAVVQSTSGVPIVVERTMFWDKDYYGGHTEAAQYPAGTKWYFAEGSQGFFDTYVLLGNAYGRRRDGHGDVPARGGRPGGEELPGRGQLTVQRLCRRD